MEQNIENMTTQELLNEINLESDTYKAIEFGVNNITLFNTETVDDEWEGLIGDLEDIGLLVKELKKRTYKGQI